MQMDYIKIAALCSCVRCWRRRSCKSRGNHNVRLPFCATIYAVLRFCSYLDSLHDQGFCQRVLIEKDIVPLARYFYSATSLYLLTSGVKKSVRALQSIHVHMVSVLSCITFCIYLVR